LEETLELARKEGDPDLIFNSQYALAQLLSCSYYRDDNKKAIELFESMAAVSFVSLIWFQP